MIVENLSSHFCYRWRRRVGGEPSLEMVNDILSTAVKIRNQRVLFYRVSKRKFRVVKLLAEYVNVEWETLVRIDVETKTAVTVICLGR